MPNAPHHPRIALPPALAARCDALRAAATTGRPSRQAVVERALGLGLDALQGLPPGLATSLAPYAWHLLAALPGCGAPGCWRVATRGHAFSPAAADLRCDDCDPVRVGQATQWGDLGYAAVVRAAVVGAGSGADGSNGDGPGADTPTGRPAPALAPLPPIA